METTDHMQENSRQPKFRLGHLSSLYDKKKVKLVTWKLTTRFIGRNALFLLESVGTWEVPPLTGMSKNNIIFPDSWRIEVKDYLFKLLKHEANAASVCCVCLRNHKSGEEFTKRSVSRLIPIFSCKLHRAWGWSTSLWTPPPPHSKSNIFCSLLPITAQSYYLFSLTKMF